MKTTVENQKQDTQSVIINYVGFKSRFAKLYSWIDEKCIATADSYSQLCANLTSKLSDIEGYINGDFLEGNVALKDGKYGNFLGYPVLNFTLPDRKEQIQCQLRINPCTPNEESDGYRHRSKIWVNIANKNKFNLDGNSVHELLRISRSISKGIATLVGTHYLLALSALCGLPVQEIDESYYASLESILMAPEDTKQEGIESLFYTGEKKHFMRLFQNSPKAQRAMKDVTEWTYDKSDIVDPIKFIKANKDKDTELKVGYGNNARILYFRRNNDNFFQVTGVGHTIDDKPDIVSLDQILLPNVASLISAL